MRCVACDSVITSGARKVPVTTFSGHMMSVYNDSIKESRKLLRKESEDLCADCITSIRGYNNDLTQIAYGSVDNSQWFPENPLEGDEAFENYNVGAEFDITEAVYEGYRERGL